MKKPFLLSRSDKRLWTNDVISKQIKCLPLHILSYLILLFDKRARNLDWKEHGEVVP